MEFDTRNTSDATDTSSLRSMARKPYRRSPLTNAIAICLVTFGTASMNVIGQSEPDDMFVKEPSLNCVDPLLEQSAPNEGLPADSPLHDFAKLAGDSASAEKTALQACEGQPGYDERREDPTIGEDKSRLGYVVPQAPIGKCFAPDLTITGGIRDNYAVPQDPATLTAEIRLAAGNPPEQKWTAFDSPSADLFFGHHMPMNFSNRYFYGTLWIEMKALPGNADNDTISLWASGSQVGTGWSANVRDIARTDGQSARIALNLGNLRSGGGSLLDDINAFRNLNIFVQDDMSIDNVRLTLSCSPPADVPLVGVIRTAGGCGRGEATQHNVFLDNEDNRNRNGRNGWIGSTISNNNTEFQLCAVDGRQFTPAANAGAAFALVALSPTCPSGFTRFDRFHDNEDNRPASWDTAPAGSPTATVGDKRDTNMAFCVATGNVPGVRNSVFPDLGFQYGVFGGRSQSRATWALQFGGVHLDDEDRNNRNQPSSLPGWTSEFMIGGGNTSYFMARVK